MTIGRYRVHPLLLGEAEVGRVLDVFWSLTKESGRVTLYPDSHTPGSQCVYVDTQEGTGALVGDIVRKIDVNVDREIPPGLFYNLESTRRAISDIKRRADRILPTHDPAIAATHFPAEKGKSC